MKVRLIDIFWLFVKVSCYLFGGGYIILPILEIEAVKKRGWVTSEELVEYYAISQFIPGINAPNVSMFVGYKLRGKLGAAVAGLGIIIIPFLLIVFLAVVLSAFTNSSLLQSAYWGVGVGIVILVSSAIHRMWVSSIIDKFTFVLFAIVFLATVSIDFSPAITVFIALIIGLLHGIFLKFIKKEPVQEVDD